MRVLLVEDDAALAVALADALARAGFVVLQARDAASADEMVQVETLDVVILDLGLPGRDGISLLTAWRQAGVTLPVLILTARGRWADKAAGFSAGADDYVTKPFEPGEVVFRLRALIRRTFGLSRPVLTAGRISLDTNSGAASVGGVPVNLTAQELRLLEYLLHAAPRVVSRSELAEHVYDRDREPDSNVIDVQIGRLRRKLGAQTIETVRGLGYRIGKASEDEA
jgi:two-component system, OmpR family, response regulator